MLAKEEIKEKVAGGWIRARMNFEIMATDQQATVSTLAEHVKKLKQAPDSEVLSEKFDQVIEVLPPPRDVKQAFSQIVEVEILSKSIEAMLLAVISFGPSSVEVLEPKELIVNYSTIQSVMNTAADLMHRFAAQGLGGIVISSVKPPQ